MSDGKPELQERSPVDAILLAGGQGTRLAPYTAVFPKPLVPLGETPVLEILLRRLRHFGLTNLVICTGHLAELIRAFFGDGERFGVQLRYTREEHPLGTAGPIRLVEDLGDPFVVMNGDLLTTLDLNALLESHRAGDAEATIAVYPREVKIDFGVLDVGQDGTLLRYHEKPRHAFDVSMGVYVFRRSVLNLITPGERLDIPELIERIQQQGQRVACFRSDCYWLDIGRPDDYAKAQEEFARDRAVFLPPASGGGAAPAPADAAGSRFVTVPPAAGRSD
jgi:NDP-sugar pyrophosphorylase family protein